MKFVAVLVLLAGLTVSAQAPQTKGPAPYTELEALRVENLSLEVRLVRIKAGLLKADLERARPGFAWNPDTGEWSAVKP